MPNWSELLEDSNHQYLMGLPDALEPWIFHDSWDLGTACQLIVLSCKLDIEKWRAASKMPVAAPEFQALSARTVCETYDRAAGMAQASIDAGSLLAHDTPANWLKWAARQGYDVAHLAMVQAAPESVSVSAKPLQRSAAQDAAILAAIEQAGHDPLALPVNEPGKPGVKAAIRVALVGVNPLFMPKSKVFDNAWERLRAHGDIADKP